MCAQDSTSFSHRKAAMTSAQSYRQSCRSQQQQQQALGRSEQLLLRVMANIAGRINGSSNKDLDCHRKSKSGSNSSSRYLQHPSSSGVSSSRNTCPMLTVAVATKTVALQTWVQITPITLHLRRRTICELPSVTRSFEVLTAGCDCQ